MPAVAGRRFLLLRVSGASARVGGRANRGPRGGNKGPKVMVFDDASGNAWIMKGFQLSMKPQRTYDDFMAAGPAFTPESISRTPTAVVAGP